MPMPVRGLGIVDFDDDDNLDVVVVGDECHDDWTNSGNDQVYLFAGDGAGGLDTPFAYDDDLGLGTDDSAYDVTIADFVKGSSLNKPDFLTRNIGADKASLQANSGSFNFTQSDRTNDCGTGFNFSDVVSEYLNPGTAYDFATVNDFGTRVRVFYGNSSGGFTHNCDEHAQGGDFYNITRTSGCTAEAQTVSGIAVGYLNGNTRWDLVATKGGCSEVAMLLGQSPVGSPGKFQFDRTDSDYFISADPPGDEEAAEIVRVLIVNLNDDAFGDIVTANHSLRNISVMINELTVGP